MYAIQRNAAASYSVLRCCGGAKVSLLAYSNAQSPKVNHIKCVETFIHLVVVLDMEQD